MVVLTAITPREEQILLVQSKIIEVARQICGEAAAQLAADSYFDLCGFDEEARSTALAARLKAEYCGDDSDALDPDVEDYDTPQKMAVYLVENGVDIRRAPGGAAATIQRRHREKSMWRTRRAAAALIQRRHRLNRKRAANVEQRALREHPAILAAAREVTGSERDRAEARARCPTPRTLSCAFVRPRALCPPNLDRRGSLCRHAPRAAPSIGARTSRSAGRCT